MKPGDTVRVALTHHYRPGWLATVLEDFAKSEHNRGKAWRVQFTDGKRKTMMSKNLELIVNTSSQAVELELLF